MHQFCDFLHFVGLFIVEDGVDGTTDFHHFVMTLEYFFIALVKGPALLVGVVFEETKEARMVIE